MLKIRTIGILISSWLISWSYVFGQTCCSGGVPLANNIGGLPDADKGTIQVSLNFDGNFLRTLKDGKETLEDLTRERTTYSILLRTAYTLNDRATIELLLSGIQQERRINQNRFQDFTRTRGIGDAVLMFYYKYFYNDNLYLVLGAGPKMPTGPSDLRNENGITLNADLQPGSGAWDAILHHRISMKIKSRPSALLTHMMTYRLTGTNPDYLGSQLYEFGNEFQMILGVSEQKTISRYLTSYGLNFRYRYAQQDRNNKEWLPNTGGQWIFIVPGFSWYTTPNMSLTLNAEFPLYSEVTGTQLTPSFRINAGVYFTINGNETRFFGSDEILKIK
jgi:hypothetical protein